MLAPIMTLWMYTLVEEFQDLNLPLSRYSPNNCSMVGCIQQQIFAVLRFVSIFSGSKSAVSRIESSLYRHTIRRRCEHRLLYQR